MSISRYHVGGAMLVGCTSALAQSPPIVFTAPGSSYTTQSATSELADICPTGQGYPAQWNWQGTAETGPVVTRTGTPRIDQVRNGQVIATYTTFANGPNCTLAGDGSDHVNPGPAAASGCGPFTREHSYRLWESGDTFLVYPAVYTGDLNQPYIGPAWDTPADYAAGIFHNPDYITVQGVVQNGVRPVILMTGLASNNTLDQAPVYFDTSTGFTFEGVDVIAAPGAKVGKAGVYESAASNLTLSDMRIAGFARAGVNGLFGAGNYSGTLTLSSVELDHNGGPNGPAHNAYITASAIDQNFTVSVSHSWSHHAYYGHLFKSRAQINVLTANFFEGTPPWGRHTQAENYLLDIPNGGQLTVRNNTFVKTASGPNSNGMSITFAMEGIVDDRPQSVDIENNTFVTFAETFDGTNPNYPLSFFYPNVIPGSSSWPSNIPTRIIKNAFVGYCPVGGGSPDDYRGDLDVTESFGELSRTFAFSTKVTTDDASLANYYSDYVPVMGTPAYAQDLDLRPMRIETTVGAQD